jgi:hypothetical protein
VLHARDEVLVRGQTDDPVDDVNDVSAVARIGARTPALENRRDAADHGADGGAVVGLHHDLFADAWNAVALDVFNVFDVFDVFDRVEQEGLGAADRTQLDGNELRGS